MQTSTEPNAPRLAPVRAVGVIALTLVTLAACAGSPETTSGGAAKYSTPGPYEVGVTTLKLPDRSVEVYYPAAKGSTAGKPRERYLQTDPIPAPMMSRLPKVPDGVDLAITIPAVRDVPASGKGPYPLVVFSHGAGGYRQSSGELMSGIASWGFVVASTDYIEYGFIAQMMGGGGGGAPPSGDAMTRRREGASKAVNGTIDLLAAESAKAGGPLFGMVDTTKVGGVGHSAGGGTMFAQLDNPRIGAIVGWAPVPPQGPVTSKTPTMIIAANDDIAIPTANLEKAFETLNAPTRLVIVKNMGHNAFTDTCISIRNGNDLIGAAKQMGLPIPERLFALAADGCAADDLDTRMGFSIIQHFTVAELRSALGVDRRPVGLAPAAATAFPGVTIDYRQDLP